MGGCKDNYSLIGIKDLVILSIYIIILRNALKCYCFNYNVTSFKTLFAKRQKN